MKKAASLVLSLLAACPMAATATASSPRYLIDDRTAQTLVKQCGMDIQIKEFAAQSQAGLVEEMKNADPASLDKAKRIAQTLNSEAAVRKAFVNRVRQAVSPEANKTNLDFCATDLGKKAIRMQKDFLMGDGKFDAFARKYESNPPPQSRINWATRVDNAIGMSKAMVEMQYALMKSMLTTINGTVAPDQRKSAAEIEQVVSAMRVETTEIARNAAIVNFMAVFDGLSEQEYGQYAQYLISEHGTAFNRASYAALVDHAVNTGELAAKMIAAPAVKKTASPTNSRLRTSDEHRHH